MSADVRTRLLEITAKVYAEAGYRGTTTRRIATEAGVNEVTLFRHFGSKDALIRESLMLLDRRETVELPETPNDPEAELLEWSRVTFGKFYRMRALVRRLIGELNEHPGIAPICDQANGEIDDLCRYFMRLKDLKLIRQDVDPQVASHLLFSAIMMDALWRDLIPNMPEAETVLVDYVRLSLRAVGAAA